MRLICICAIFSGSLASADCVDVIKAAALRGTVIEDASQVEAEVKRFCSEYASSKAAGEAFSGNVSYGTIGIGAGSSSQSIEQVASKYCDASDMSNNKSNYYEQYVEEIAPGAFESYDRCIESSDTRVSASLDPNAIHAKSLTIVISSRQDTSSGGQDKVQFVPSDGISCSWTNKINAETDENTVTISADSSAGLYCTRQDDTVQGSITLDLPPGSSLAVM